MRNEMTEDEAVRFLRDRGFRVQEPSARLEAEVLARAEAGDSVGQISGDLGLPLVLVFSALWACGVPA
jgi:hypothetical protein